MKNFYNGLRTPILNSVCDVDSRRTARMMAVAPKMLELLKRLGSGYGNSALLYEIWCSAEALIDEIEREDA